MVNLFFVPPLKTIALNRVSVDVCCRREIFSTIESKPNFQGSVIIDSGIASRIINWWIIRTKPIVNRIVDKFEMPMSLKLEVSENVIKIGVQIHFWKFANSESAIYDFLVKHFYLVCWSNFGEIDEKQTVKKVVEFYLQYHSILTNISPWLLLFMTCYYCMEDTISRLLPHIHHFDMPPGDFPGDKMARSPLTLYWLNILVGDFVQHSFLQLYCHAIISLNLPAIEYFFNRLSVKEKEESFRIVREIISTLPHASGYVRKLYPASSMVFLLSNLTDVGQKKIFQKYHMDILYFLLSSSHRISFLNVFDILSKYTTVSDLFRLLTWIASKPDEVCFRYSDIFIKIFETCPVESKEVLIERMLNSHRNKLYVLPSLVEYNNIKCIHSLLVSASSEQRYKIRKFVKNHTRYVED